MERTGQGEEVMERTGQGEEVMERPGQEEVMAWVAHIGSALPEVFSRFTHLKYKFLAYS